MTVQESYHKKFINQQLFELCKPFGEDSKVWRYNVPFQLKIKNKRSSQQVVLDNFFKIINEIETIVLYEEILNIVNRRLK